MSQSIFSIDNIDNTNTLFENVIKKNYPADEWDSVLIKTKFLRNSILKTIKKFIESQGTVCLKEFSDNPPMIYDDPNKFNLGIKEIATDFIIVKNAYNLLKINQENSKIHEKYSLAIEALNPNGVSKTSWDNLLDDIYLNYGGNDVDTQRVQKIVIENTIDTLKKWRDTSNTIIKDMIRSYNHSHGIKIYNPKTFWQQPIDLISKNFWEKFSFILTINDYELYDDSNTEYLNVISDKYFNNGYFDEVVIKINYFYWYDNYQKIIDWTTKNLKSALVSYRLDTMFSNKNRYYNDAQAMLYGDVQRKNSIEEELVMFDEKPPILLNQILKNPQTYGFELEGGYFGSEGFMPVAVDSDKFELFKNTMCKTLDNSPFARTNDYFKITAENPKRIFFCLKR